MWQLAQAKNKLSEVFTKAMTEGPQTISRRGEEAILISKAEYEKLTRPAEPKMTPGAFLLRGPSRTGIRGSRQGLRT